MPKKQVGREKQKTTPLKLHRNITKQPKQIAPELPRLLIKQQLDVYLFQSIYDTSQKLRGRP